MKKNALPHAAAMLLLLPIAIGCQQSELFEENAPTQGAMKEITVQASMGDGSNTRATMTPDGEDITNATWVSAWENDDKLGAWTAGETGLSEFNILPGYDNTAKTASFTGSVSSAAQNVRFIYPYNTQPIISNEGYKVDISIQYFNGNAPFDEYAQNKPMISELLDVTDDQIDNVKLRNLCAGMEYKLAFKNIKAEHTDIRVTDIIISSTSICAARTLNFNNGELTDNSDKNKITIRSINLPKLNSYTGTTRFSIIGAVFPFKLPAGSGEITVEVITNYGKVTVTKTNTSTEEIDFYLGAHHYINLDVDMSQLSNDDMEYWIDYAADNFGSGAGTESDPWMINTPEQLAKLLKDIHTGSASNVLSGKFFKLGNDIDLSDKKWGYKENSYSYFGGTFDGNDKTVTGLYINNSHSKPQGLFTQVSTDGSIKNVSVVGSINCSTDFVGGIIGYNKGNIIECSFSGYIYTTGSYAGGIVGYNNKSISSCHNKGIITGSNYVGGIVGYGIWYDSITSCSNTGNITGKLCVGGIAGFGGDISSNYNTGNISGDKNVGGITGKGSNISSCYNTGTISGSTHTAGIVGYTEKYITFCYNTGKVSGNDMIGGIAGFGYGETSYCYNTGDVSGTSTVGGIVGKPKEISYCYNTGKITGSFHSGALVGYIETSAHHCYSLIGSHAQMIG